MKKIFTTLLIIAGIYTTASAQMHRNVELGLDIGYNSSYVIASGSNVNSPAIGGYNVGVYVDAPFARDWSIKIKMIADQKGWGDGFLTDNSGNEVDHVNFRLSYLTVPVMANWHFGRTHNWYLDFGPYIGFLEQAKANDVNGQNNINVKEAFNSTDGGIAFGLGVKFPISEKAKFFIEYDAQVGLGNVFNDSGDGSNVQNARSSFNIGVAF